LYGVRGVLVAAALDFVSEESHYNFS
jgi:hypothetical protein